MGTWIQFTVQGWLVYRLTTSPFALGAVSFAGQATMLIFSLAGGALADRTDKRKALAATQFLAMLQALILGILTITGAVNIRHIFFLSMLAGTINAFDMPIRQSFIVDMVGRTELPNAIALNSSIFNLARIIGPAIAGLVLGIIGEGPCFLINAATYIPVIFVLLFIRAQTVSPAQKIRQGALYSIKEGIRYSMSAPHLKAPLVLMLMTSLVAMPAMNLMPVVAAEMLKGKAGTLGYLFSCVGAGALMGAISMAVRKKIKGLPAMILFSSAFFGISLAALSLSKNLWLSGGFLVLAGFGMATQAVGCNTILQSFVKNEFRGRIMSLFSLSFIGFAPIGSLLAGKIAQTAGIETMLRLGGIWMLLSSAVFYKAVPYIKKSLQLETDSQIISDGETAL